ncbi:MAG: hypothetical protein B6D63_06740 [Candidatus Latescibacteria bacterium 4484_7]|nr:MAG: hypothetical protein B6D63_06740 [Candidatus Latescibacteria bacterium 4484_7]
MSRGGATKRFIKRKAAVFGLVTFLVILAMTFAADLFLPAKDGEMNLSMSLRPPSIDHPFGTDTFGRDILYRILHGARISLSIGFLARTLSLVLGLGLGILSGYVGGKVDSVIMRLADITFAFPTLLLLIAITAVLTPGIVPLFVALGVVGWAAMARIVRGMVMSVKTKEFVQAARASGAGHFSLIFRHILPESISPVIVVYTLGLGMTIMAEASLSFLGLGIQAPTPSWGKMISTGIPFLRTAPWLTFFPGLFLTLTVCSLNLIGDGLRDAFDIRRD